MTASPVPVPAPAGEIAPRFVSRSIPEPPGQVQGAAQVTMQGLESRALRLD